MSIQTAKHDSVVSMGQKRFVIFKKLLQYTNWKFHDSFDPAFHDLHLKESGPTINLETSDMCSGLASSTVGTAS